MFDVCFCVVRLSVSFVKFFSVVLVCGSVCVLGFVFVLGFVSGWVCGWFGALLMLLKVTFNVAKKRRLGRGTKFQKKEGNSALRLLLPGGLG